MVRTTSNGVGPRVQSLRQQRGWTAQRLAAECARAGMPSLTRGTLAKIESGVRKSVTAAELVALAHAFGVPVADLLPPEDSTKVVEPGQGFGAAVSLPIQNSGLYFYLSYAHGPTDYPVGRDPDLWVAQLYSDLCDHIKSLADLPPGREPGFMDRDLRQGQEWPDRLSDALATCRVFVPLYSRRYFKSEHCGREWFAFSRRAQNQAAKGGPIGAIVPALWIPVRDDDELPQAARSVQFDPGGINPLYAEHGFYGIMKVSRWREAYEEAVYLLARQIVDAAEISPAEPGIAMRDYESLDSAFRPSGNHMS